MSTHRDDLTFAAAGDQGELFRRITWEKTGLGHSGRWPQALRTLLNVMLNCQQPTFIAWGPQRVWLNNEACIPILADKHPAAIGRPSHEVWSEAWSVLGPLFDRVFAGEPISMQDFSVSLLRRGRLQRAFFDFSYTPVRNEDGTVAGLFGVCVETTDRVNDAMASVDAISRQQRLFDQAPGFVAILDGPRHVVRFANEAYRRLIDRDIVGQTIAEGLPEVAEQGFIALLDEVYRTAVPFSAQEQRVTINEDDGKPVEHFVDFVYQPVLDPEGHSTGIFVHGFDVTDEVYAKRDRDVLIQELQHRIRNTLSMVSALMSQTFRSTTSSAEAQSILSARISALAAANDMLTRTSWAATHLTDLVRLAVAPHQSREGQFTLAGDDVKIGSREGLAFSLALHELATNAAKYGALSTVDGSVAIRWTTDPDGEFRFVWTETGGPKVSAPTRRGFGRQLIEVVLGETMKGDAQIDFAEGGVTFTLVTATSNLDSAASVGTQSG
ncbi:MAG: sensor histidine kinase [Bauldia sp.]